MYIYFFIYISMSGGSCKAMCIYTYVFYVYYIYIIYIYMKDFLTLKCSFKSFGLQANIHYK